MKAENERKRAEQKKKELNGTDDSWPRGANLEVVYAKFGQLAEKLEKYVDHENTYGMLFQISFLALSPYGLSSQDLLSLHNKSKVNKNH